MVYFLFSRGLWHLPLMSVSPTVVSAIMIPATRTSSECLSAVYFIFRFITGFCGSAFLSVAGGSVSDLFSNETVAKYVFSLSVKMLDQSTLCGKSYGAVHN
jgi:MFS family permease